MPLEIGEDTLDALLEPDVLDVMGYEDFDDDDWDIMGDDDDDDIELVGRSGKRRRRRRNLRRRLAARGRRRRRGRGGARQAALAVKVAEDSALVRRKPYTSSREWVLGFDSGSTDVPAAGSATIISRPQVVFRPERLAVASATASSFLITDLKIGKNSQFLSGDPVPAEAFANISVGVGMKMDTAVVNQDISIAVSNISGSGARFLAGLYGTAIE